jgi:hypothetical protein
MMIHHRPDQPLMFDKVCLLSAFKICLSQLDSKSSSSTTVDSGGAGCASFAFPARWAVEPNRFALRHSVSIRKQFRPRDGPFAEVRADGCDAGTPE